MLFLGSVDSLFDEPRLHFFAIQLQEDVLAVQSKGHRYILDGILHMAAALDEVGSFAVANRKLSGASRVGRLIGPAASVSVANRRMVQGKRPVLIVDLSEEA